MSNIINYSKYRKISIILMLVFIIIHMSPKILMLWVEPGLLNYRILPIIWGIFLFVIFHFIPHVHPIGRVSMLENIYLESIVCAAVLTVIQFLAGSMIGELGESPYILTPTGIFENLLYILPPLIAREIIRTYTLGTFCIKSNIKAFILITAIMTLISVNYASLQMIKNLHDFTIFLAQEFGPLLCQNIILSYLALYGGSIAALSYLGIITLFHWTSPILPVLNWLAEGAIGILVPVFSLMFIIKKYENRVNNVKKEDMKKWDAVQWIITAVFSIGLIWFVVGVFPIVPSVVATGSMEPLIYPGDIILLKQVRTEDQVLKLKTGDIIQFQRDDIRITHRISKIEKDKSGKLTYHTKGDNNSVEDTKTVDPKDIKGIYFKVIPKLGYPTLLLKSQISEVPMNEVEN